MPTDHPSASELSRESNKRKDQRKKIYAHILDAVYIKIKSKADMGWSRIVHTIPSFVVGLPPYDTQECTNYVARRLRKKGYKVEMFDNAVLYISWDQNEL